VEDPDCARWELASRSGDEGASTGAEGDGCGAAQRSPQKKNIKFSAYFCDYVAHSVAHKLKNNSG